jgi:hypothetical protein
VQNTRGNSNIKFNIVNFVKPDSLYNHGMRLLIYSQKKFEATGDGWFRGGENIKYHSNGIKRNDVINYKTYYTLSFKYIFQFSKDTIYFANSFPYTYTQLQDCLTQLEADEHKKEFVNVKPLCKTLAGNRCDTVIITSSRYSEDRAKRGVVFSGRVHPGETCGSWMM